tara:strand:+ start:68 stop:790 length:723 start_codon:yes stop_codon:yes gene_type:complete
MRYKISFAITFLIFNLVSTYAVGQTTRQNSWHRITIQTPIDQKLSVSSEFQYRTQNDFDNNHYYSQPLTSSFRLWIDYKKNETISFSLSPFSYFDQRPSYNLITDHDKPHTNEYRFAGAVTIQKPVFSNFNAFTKLGLEFQHFDNKKDKYRLRGRAGFSYQYTIWTFSTYNELFLNVAGTPLTHFYNQNRICGSINANLHRNFGMEIGYIHGDKLPRQSETIQKERILYLNLTVKLNTGK